MEILKSWLTLEIALHKRSGVDGRNFTRLEKEAHNLER